MSLSADLCSDVDSFLSETGMAPSTFGRKALNDGKFVSRLRSGEGITLKTLERVKAFIAVERAAHAAPGTEPPAATEASIAVPDASAAASGEGG